MRRIPRPPPRNVGDEDALPSTGSSMAAAGSLSPTDDRVEGSSRATEAMHRRMKHVVQLMRRHATVVVAREQREQRLNGLTVTSAVPIALGQRWCGLMQQIVATAPRATSATSDDDDNQDSASHPAGVPMHSSSTVAQDTRSNDHTGDAHDRETSNNSTAKGHYSHAPLGSSSNSISAATSRNVQIALNVRCRDALGVLEYLEKLREDRNGDQNAGWDWVEDSSKCNAIFDLLVSVKAIRSLDSIFRRKLLPQLELRRLRKGDEVFHEGDEESIVWLIIRGKVIISTTRVSEATVHAGELSEGQIMGNLLPETRLATATCLEQSILLRVDSSRYHMVLRDAEAIRSIQQKKFFKSVSLFRGLGDKDLDRLTSVFRLVALPAGHILCREGNRVDYIYLVKRGSCRLLKAFIPSNHTTEEAEKPNKTHHGKAAAHSRRGRTGRNTARFVPADSGVTTAGGIVVRPIFRQNEEEGNHAFRGEVRVSKAGEAKPEDRGWGWLQHFDVGELGRKDFVGEGGFTAAASARAGEASRALFSRDMRSGEKHLVSVTSACGADIYVAKVADLLPLQSVAVGTCWAEGQRYHRARMQGWDPQSLGAGMQRQFAWEEAKRTIVLNCVRVDKLKKKMAGTGQKERVTLPVLSW